MRISMNNNIIHFWCVAVIWLLVTLQSVGCTIIKKPNATYTIDEGEDLQLECSTDLDKSMIWWFAKHDSSPKIEVAWGLVIGGVVKSRYKINSTTPKDFNLVILNADRDHAGNYTCYDDEGADNVGVSTQLRVGKQHGEWALVDFFLNTGTILLLWISWRMVMIWTPVGAYMNDRP